MRGKKKEKTSFRAVIEVNIALKVNSGISVTDLANPPTLRPCGTRVMPRSFPLPSS